MWGTNEKGEKVLIALALRAAENAVDIYTFPFESTSEEFYNLMLNEWRESHEVSMPEGHTHLVKALTASDSLLPEGLKVDRADIIQRAQSEWHFVVLSNKLYQSFLSELEDIKEKIKGTDFYKNQLWEEMKEAWEKIQKNIFDKTLMREHGQQLREMTNDIFTQLKNMRKDMDSEVDRVSRDFADKFNKTLDEVEAKIKSGLGLQPLFNDLKDLQHEFKDAQLSRNDRSKIWKRIDVAFKAVKEKKFGEKSTKDTSALERLNRRYEGLVSAIDKMDKSIRRDDKDKNFQDDRIANTEGQLEAQIRMAKLKMIDERINSKNEKLAEMVKTKTELEERINREKKFLEEQKKHQALKDELKEAKENVKQKIAENIHAQSDSLDADALGKAADAIAEEKARKAKPKESFLSAISETLGESLEDVGHSLGAIASVVAEKIEDAFKGGKDERGNEKKDNAESVNENTTYMNNPEDNHKDHMNESSANKEGSDFTKITDKLETAFKDLKEEAGEIFNELKDDMKETFEDLKHKFKKEDDSIDGDPLHEDADQKQDNSFSAMTDKMETVFQDLKERAGIIINDVRDEVKESYDELKNRMKKEDNDNPGEDGGENSGNSFANKMEDVFHDIKENATDVFNDVKEEVQETVSDLKGKFRRSEDTTDDTNESEDQSSKTV